MIKTGKAEISLLDNGNLCISVPIIIKLKHGRKVIIAPQSLAGKVLGGENPVNESLALMLARGYAWMKMLDEGKIHDIQELVEKTGYHRTHVWRILMTANLSPALTEAVLNGTEPDGLSMQKIKSPIPEDWQMQEKLIG